MKKSKGKIRMSVMEGSLDPVARAFLEDGIVQMPKMLRLIETNSWDGYEYKQVIKFFRAIGKDLDFISWYSGKTGGISDKGKFCIYKWDFDKFCESIGLSIGWYDK